MLQCTSFLYASISWSNASAILRLAASAFSSARDTAGGSGNGVVCVCVCVWVGGCAPQFQRSRTPAGTRPALSRHLTQAPEPPRRRPRAPNRRLVISVAWLPSNSVAMMLVLDLTGMKGSTAMRASSGCWWNASATWRVRACVCVCACVCWRVCVRVPVCARVLCVWGARR